MAEVFRIRMSMGTEHSGGGVDWPLYDDREEFEQALLEAALEAGARGDLYRQPERKRIRAWVLRKQPKSVEDGSLRRYGVRKVFAAEQFIDGEWVSLEWEITPPQVTVRVPGA